LTLPTTTEGSLNSLQRKITGEAEKLKVEEEDCLVDALALYKSSNFDPRVPLKIRFKTQPAVDTGGVLKHFFTCVYLIKW